MSYRFSSRTNWNTAESHLAAVVRQARAAGKSLVDLTVSNPTVCGFQYDQEAILSALSDPGSLIYDPDPRGLLSAREAVADYYADHRAHIDPSDLILTTSTSEGYSYLFRLLCDAGDEVLIPQPSYPLFDFLADLDDVSLRPYPLFYDYGWWIDFAELERAIGSRTKAIMVVHPNNPTGHWTSALERERLRELCARYGLALIVDEVFLDYPLSENTDAVSFAGEPRTALTFVLSGMSKIAGLPQMKAAWILALGPDAVRLPALDRLEVIADTFLSMNMPVQKALPTWLAQREGIQRQILARVRRNLAAAESLSNSVLRTQAGWSAMLRSTEAIEEIVLGREVIVHPGSFFGIGNRIVVSLLGPEKNFVEGLKRITNFSYLS